MSLIRNHVLKDLEPYMCTFPQCSKPDQMYSSRLDWQEHELEEHRSEWHCNVTDHKAYQSQGEFKAHMVEQHASSLSPEQLNPLLHSFRRPQPSGEKTCPLCLKVTERVENHLARHHTQIALFAIPRIHYGDEESDTSSANSKVAAAASANSGSLTSLNTESMNGSAKLENVDSYNEFSEVFPSSSVGSCEDAENDTSNRFQSTFTNQSHIVESMECVKF